MPKKERLFIPDLPQLIAFKGNNNEAVFRDQEDYQFFLSCLKKGIAQHAISLHAFSLLRSQIYLLLSAKDLDALSRLTQYLGRCYVGYFNQRHQRSGSLWEGRYRSCNIEASSYFLLCQKYVETRISQEDDHSVEKAWSSERANSGQEPLNFITPHPLYLALAPDSQTRFARYRQFMALPLAASLAYRIETCLPQNCVLGTLSYCLELENRLHHPVRPRMTGRPRKYYPNQLNFWLWLEQEAQSTIRGYGYREIRLPLLEMQNGISREEVSALLRREGTTGCLHAIARNRSGILPIRLWYQGPMFRARAQSTPQLEEFHQIGTEALGYRGIGIELEQLLIQYQLFQRLKLTSFLELQINSLGDLADQERYRDALRRHFASALAKRDPGATLRPEALLDPASGLSQELRLSAPGMDLCLSDASLERFARLTQGLQALGIPYALRTDLLAHRHYYEQTYFEWHTAILDTQSVVCRGGRYDRIASQILGRETPACGFALMVEPLIQLAEKSRAGHPLTPQSIDVAILCDGGRGAAAASYLGNILRGDYPFLAVVNDYTTGRLDGRRTRAIKNGARLVINVLEPGLDADLYLGDANTVQRSAIGEVASRVRGWLI